MAGVNEGRDALRLTREAGLCSMLRLGFIEITDSWTRDGGPILHVWRPPFFMAGPLIPGGLDR